MVAHTRHFQGSVRQPSDPGVDLDCYLEIEGKYAPWAEEIAGAVADEIEAWVDDARAIDGHEVDAARAVAKQIRVLGWLVGSELGDDPAASRERFEVLMDQVGEIMLASVCDPKARRHFSTAMVLATQSLYDLESEETVVKRGAWERTPNRALPGSDRPPPSGRPVPTFQSVRPGPASGPPSRPPSGPRQGS